MLIKEPLRLRKTRTALPSRVAGNWFAIERLRFIEERLFWTGRINRADIVQRFGLHVSNASKDLTDYQALAPRNVIYDSSAKTYRTGPRFVPFFEVPTFDKLLGHVFLDDRVPSPRPLFDWVRAPQRYADPLIVRNVIEAAADGLAVNVHYLSLSHPAGRWRWVEPHSVAFDGQRWHARGWCRLRAAFRDFNLGRMTEIAECGQATADPAADGEWNEFVDVIIAPHRGLSVEQRELVARDYAMRHERATFPCRTALLRYLLINLGLDQALGPPRQLIELVDPGLGTKAGL